MNLIFNTPIKGYTTMRATTLFGEEPSTLNTLGTLNTPIKGYTIMWITTLLYPLKV